MGMVDITASIPLRAAGWQGGKTMQVIEVRTDFVHIRAIATDREQQNREWLYRHSLHQMIRQYRREFGEAAAADLMHELDSYHTVRTVGMG
jgi:glutamate synthase domain-containing protein 3